MSSSLGLRKMLGFFLEHILEHPRLISFKNKRTNCSLTFLQRQVVRAICVYVLPHNCFLIDPRSLGKVQLSVLIFHSTLTDGLVVWGGEILFVPCWSLCLRSVGVKVGWKCIREGVESVIDFKCKSLCSCLFVTLVQKFIVQIIKLLVVPSLLQDTQARAASISWARMNDEAKVVNLKFHRKLPLSVADLGFLSS